MSNIRTNNLCLHITIVGLTLYVLMRGFGCNNDSPCEDAMDLFTYAQDIHTEMVENIPFGTTWQVIVKQHMYKPAVIERLPAFWIDAPMDDKETGELEYSSQTETSFAVPPAPSPLSCERVKEIKDQTDGDEQMARDWIFAELMFEWMDISDYQGIQAEGSDHHFQRVVL